MVQAEVSSSGGDHIPIFFFSNDFYFSFVRPSLMDFSDIVILYSRPNSCLPTKCFDMP